MFETVILESVANGNYPLSRKDEAGMDYEDLAKELRLQTAILRAAFRTQLSEFSQELLADEVNRAILGSLEGGVMPSASLQEAVFAQVPTVSGRTITRRISSLVEVGVLRRSGHGVQTTLELTGLL
ncbi:MAG TPA: hypothetical protein VFS30_12590 [Dehalococcoidia bacterium]|nr:hypothetical protein [Dehalococcoidia bacterium]